MMKKLGLVLILVNFMLFQVRLAVGQFNFGGLNSNPTPKQEQVNTKGAEEITSWKVYTEPSLFSLGDTISLVLETTIEDEWYIYGSDFDSKCGPTLTSIDFSTITGAKTVGTLKSPNSKRKFDEVFGCEYSYFKKKAKFIQKLVVSASSVKLTGFRNYQVCTLTSGLCIPGEGEFTLALKASPAKNQTPKTDVPVTQTAEIKVVDTTISVPKHDSSSVENTPTVSNTNGKGWANLEIIRYSDEKGDLSQQESESYLWFMLVAFLSGLAALITPCVFPMIPMTVTFFTKNGKSDAKGIGHALIYGVSIVLIYVVFGTVIAAINGPGFANWLSTNWVPNVLFFIVFIVFAISFLGFFEITLPHNFINKVDKQADKGGLLGVFFMAFTLVLVSFSCTGPIVGSILVEAAGGAVIKPVLGMMAFSMAFAIPFTLFAIFPSWLKKLPKSGGWLNTVKVVLGFLELALAFKFLSVADQAYHWNLLSRTTFLVIWVIVFVGLAIYLFGFITLPHDSKGEKISLGRKIIGLTTVVFVGYLVAGFFQFPMGALAGLLPPENKMEQAMKTNELCENPSHTESLHLPHGLSGYFDLREAAACSYLTKKPIFVDFTGHGCVNCRKMEENVWSDSKVLKTLQDNFTIVALYVDDKVIKLPLEQQYENQRGRLVTTLGDMNFDLELSKFNQQAQPFYVLLEVKEFSKDKIVLQELSYPKSYDSDPKSFLSFLKGVLY